jgi:hypothetical protein
MKGMITRFLVLGVPGLCFVIAGALNNEYPLIALGGILVIDSAYGLSRKRGVMAGNFDQRRQRRSFALAGVIGASFAIRGFVSHGYLLAAAGTVIFVGSLLRLHRTTPSDGRYGDANMPPTPRGQPNGEMK